MKNRWIVKTAYWLLVAAVIAGTALGIYFYFVYSPPGRIPAASAGKLPGGKDDGDKTKVKSVSVKRPNITHMADGQVKWELKADEVVSEPATGKSVLRGSSGQIFGANGRIISFFAPLTVYDPATNEVRIDGRFSGEVGSQGISMGGSNLRWNDKQDMLSADDADLSVKDAKIKGDRVTILPGKKSVTFEGNVEIELPLKKKTDKKK
jgi:hypothetical protein